MSALNQKMFCANVRWNWLGGSGEDFQISLMYFRLFHYFVIISPWKRARPFISTNLNWQIDNGQQAIRKAHLILKFRWAKHWYMYQSARYLKEEAKGPYNSCLSFRYSNQRVTNKMNCVLMCIFTSKHINSC